MKNKANYHSRRGEIVALNFALEKYTHSLLQGPFLVRTDNMTVLHWKTMKNLSGTTRRWLTNFSYFLFSIEHRAGVQLSDADHISRQTNLPEATPSEVELESTRRHTNFPSPFTAFKI